KTKTRERPNFSHIRNDTIQLAKQSWPLGLSSLLVLSYSKLDLILINSLGSPNETGIYAAGSKILEYLGVFPSIFSISILPLIFSVFRNHEAGSQKERERVSMAIGVANILAWIIPIAMYALAPWIITLLYGTAFREAVSILRTIVWIFPLTLFGVVRQGFLLLNEKLSICIALEALTLALLVGFNYLLIPKHGAQGSATALLLTSLMVNIAAIVVSKSVRNIAKFYIKSIWSCRRFRLTNIKRCVESLGIFKPH
ncbi:MAG TPA: oligosaccharide flippase family protein, partial [Oligoflexia bacterium]|nr:oligosaccharide flippase family protein [Oligoflexia bacterium]